MSRSLSSDEGEKEKKEVVAWIKAGKNVRGVIGFAVGRTVFLLPLVNFKNKLVERQEAVEKIAENYKYFMRFLQTNFNNTNMKNIYVTRMIPESAIEMLRDKGYEVDVSEKDGVLGKNGLITGKLKKRNMARYCVF